MTSQITLKSTNPRFAWISRRYGSTMLINPLLVVSSLSSNNCACAAPSRACSIVKNKRRTFILSNADGYDRAVLSPNKNVPLPV